MDSAPRFTKSTISGMGRSLDERFRKGKEKIMGSFPHPKGESPKAELRAAGSQPRLYLGALLKVSRERGQQDWNRVNLVSSRTGAVSRVIPIKHDREEKLLSSGGFHNAG